MTCSGSWPNEMLGRAIMENAEATWAETARKAQGERRQS